MPGCRKFEKNLRSSLKNWYNLSDSEPKSSIAGRGIRAAIKRLGEDCGKKQVVEKKINE